MVFSDTRKSAIGNWICFVWLIALGGLVMPDTATALGPSNKVRAVQIRYAGGNWIARPGALRVLMREVAFRTSIETDLSEIHRTLDAPDLFEYPLLILSGDRPFPRFPDDDIRRLRHHLEAGGLLVIDNAGESERNATGFSESIRRLTKRLFPMQRLNPIASEHVVYRSFFRLDYPSGRNLRKGYMEGISLGRKDTVGGDDSSRIAIIYNHNDWLGALARDEFENWAFDLVPGMGKQREMAIRLGVNMVMYALCLHYKDDQVHLRYLLKKRNWRIRPPENP